MFALTADELRTLEPATTPSPLAWTRHNSKDGQQWVANLTKYDSGTVKQVMVAPMLGARNAIAITIVPRDGDSFRLDHMPRTLTEGREYADRLMGAVTAEEYRQEMAQAEAEEARESATWESVKTVAANCAAAEPFQFVATADRTLSSADFVVPAIPTDAPTPTVRSPYTARQIARRNARRQMAKQSRRANRRAA